MVTGFSLRQGYVFCNDQEITMEQLFEICRKVGNDQEKLYNKCLEYGLKEELECDCKLSELVARYKDLPTEDGTCTFHDDDEYGDGMVLQSCYGGGTHRTDREQICRAFGVLVLDECYKQGYSVCFNIS